MSKCLKGGLCLNVLNCDCAADSDYHGFLFDENLSWTFHLNELSSTLTRTCGVFFRVKHLLPRSDLISLYNSLFASFLQHVIVVWGLTSDLFIKPVFILQNKAVRAIVPSKIITLCLLLFF